MNNQLKIYNVWPDNNYLSFKFIEPVFYYYWPLIP